MACFVHFMKFQILNPYSEPHQEKSQIWIPKTKIRNTGLFSPINSAATPGFPSFCTHRPNQSGKDGTIHQQQQSYCHRQFGGFHFFSEGLQSRGHGKREALYLSCGVKAGGAEIIRLEAARRNKNSFLPHRDILFLTYVTTVKSSIKLQYGTGNGAGAKIITKKWSRGRKYRK